MIDRERLARLRSEEEARFVARPPPLRGARRGGPGPAAGRRADALDDPLAGLLPGVPSTATGARLTDVDGLEYVDLCLGDTGRDDRARAAAVADALDRAGRGPASPRCCPRADAVWVGEELARRFGLPRWQMAMSATDANRFVLRFARHLTGRPADRGDGLVLPRHRRRDPGRARRTGAVVPRPGAHGAAGRRRRDDRGGAVQRPRGAGPAAGRGRRGRAC